MTSVVSGVSRPGRRFSRVVLRISPNVTDSGVSISPPTPDLRIPRPWQILILIAALTAMALILFRNFVWGPDTLLYKDIGSDSLNVSYPYYLVLSDYIRHVGVPLWTFRIGMGQNLFPYIGTILVSPVVWLPQEAIARALVYQHFLYVLISGLFFARFLALRGLNFQGSLLGALLLSFSAYLCMGSCWYFHATEVVCFTILLFAAESAVSRGRWIHLVLAVALVGFFSVFHLYLCALLLCCYVPIRAAVLVSDPNRSAVRRTLLLGAAAFLGGGAFLLPAVASAHSVTHTLKFTAVTVQSANFSKTTAGQSGKDLNKAGKIIGFDMLYFVFNPKTHVPSASVTLDINGGFLYGTLKFSQGPLTHGTVTGGTGKFKGATGRIRAKLLDSAGTHTAVTITYHT